MTAVAAAVPLLLEAYVADPVLRWMYPDDATYPAMAGAWLHARLAPAAGRVTIAFSRCGGAVACWRAPGPLPAAAAAKRAERELLDGQLGARAADVLRALEEAAAYAPPVPHLTLAYVGTRPELRGRGVASRLLRPELDRASARGVTAFLLSSNRLNVPFYERLGFEVVGGVAVAPGGPVLRPMTRPAGTV